MSIPDWAKAGIIILQDWFGTVKVFHSCPCRLFCSCLKHFCYPGVAFLSEHWKKSETLSFTIPKGIGNDYLQSWEIHQTHPFPKARFHSEKSKFIYLLDRRKNGKISWTSPHRSPWASGFHSAVSLSSGSERQPGVMKWISKVRDSSGIWYPLSGPLQTHQICFCMRPGITRLFLCWHLALTICYFHTPITKALLTSWGIEIDLCLVDLPSFSVGIFLSALLPVSYDGRVQSEGTQALFFSFFWCRL